MLGRRPNQSFWRGRRVLVTGHTGFKGSWLCLMLDSLGADVFGWSDRIPTDPSFFVEARVCDALTDDLRGDVRDAPGVMDAFEQIKPDTVLHLAAQPLVLQGIRDPVGTFSTNVMGAVHILEACRQSTTVRSCVIVTTDKVYKAVTTSSRHSEEDEIGGHEPYGASKAGAELVASSYVTLAAEGGPQIATARAGNVIGGGDWSQWRLLPDLLAALDTGEELLLRSPEAVRPWQHVLDPLTGYLLLAERLESETAPDLPRCWNFGPESRDDRTVLDVVHAVERFSGRQLRLRVEGSQSVESEFLALSSDRARETLGWRPRWDFDASVAQTVEWHLDWRAGRDIGEVSRNLVSQQLGDRRHA
jgi:CDP-glucose 4,6-dehydratase